MKLLYSRCAGLDVHKKSIRVCVWQGNGKKLKMVSNLFGTFTVDLERLRDFLIRNKVHRVVMESAGVYWIPVWNVLDRARVRFDLGAGQPTAGARFAWPLEKRLHRTLDTSRPSVASL